MKQLSLLLFGTILGALTTFTGPSAARAEGGLYCANLQGREILAQAVRDYIKDSLLDFAADSAEARLKLDEFEIVESRQAFRSGNYVACQVFIKATIKHGAFSRIVPFELPVAAGYDRQGKLRLRLFESRTPVVRSAKLAGA